MIERLTLCLSADHAGLRLCAGGILKSMTQGLTLGLATYRTGLRLGTGCRLIFVNQTTA